MNTSTTITAYEQRIAKLEKEKHIIDEKLEIGCGPKAIFEDMFERRKYLNYLGF